LIQRMPKSYSFDILKHYIQEAMLHDND